MSFATVDFLLFFMLIFLVRIFLHKNISLYKIFLLNIGLVFYSFFGLNLLWIVLASIAINYQFLYLLAAPKSKKYRKIILSFGVISNVFFLGVYKYFNFFIENLIDLLYKLHFVVDLQILQIIAPVGISFLVFRSISHLVDVYRGQALPSVIDFANYILFLPSIVAGPINKSADFYADLNRQNTVKTNITWAGILIFSGLFKKLVLSSYLHSFIQEVFVNPDIFSSADLLIYLVLYGVYLYVDFSGYSDLAIGLAMLLGFNFKLNFNQPFRSLSISEFWRRWHISLGAWLREYIYLPLGGDGRGTQNPKIIKIRNLILVMLVSGVWHGAGWGFLLWGLGHGFLMSLESLFKNIFNKISWFTAPIFWFYNLLFVSLLWVFFNTKSWEQSTNYFYSIFNNWNINTTTLPLQVFVVLFIVLFLNIIPINLDKTTQIFNKLHLSLQIFIFIILSYLVIKLGPELIPPFVYAGF